MIRVRISGYESEVFDNDDLSEGQHYRLDVDSGILLVTRCGPGPSIIVYAIKDFISAEVI